MNKEIKQVSVEELDKIINERTPRGLYYSVCTKDNGKEVYVGVDNSTENAWTEEFDTLDKCKNWLMIYSEIDTEKADMDNPTDNSEQLHYDDIRGCVYEVERLGMHEEGEYLKKIFDKLDSMYDEILGLRERCDYLESRLFEEQAQYDEPQSESIVQRINQRIDMISMDIDDMIEQIKNFVLNLIEQIKMIPEQIKEYRKSVFIHTVEKLHITDVMESFNNKLDGIKENVNGMIDELEMMSEKYRVSSEEDIYAEAAQFEESDLEM